MRNLMLGVLLGVLITLAAIDVLGGRWEYRLLDASLCQQNRSLGVSHVAPNQPNPCLIRSPRWSLLN